MRSPLEMNPYFRQDVTNKWVLTNQDASDVPKYGLVVLDEAVGTLGVRLALAGGNVTDTTSLFYADQIVRSGQKQRFFRTGIVEVDTGGLATGPVYLSGSTPGGLAFIKPATGIIVGNIIDEDRVFLDLAGMSALDSTAATSHLPETTYWLSDSGDAENRQFDTIFEAYTQAQTDHPAGQMITFDLENGNAFSTPFMTFNADNPITFRNGTIAPTTTFPAGSTLYFENCTVRGNPTFQNCYYVVFRDCIFEQSFLGTVDTNSNTTSVYFDIINCTGAPTFTQVTPTTTAQMQLNMFNCAFRYDAVAQLFVTLTRGYANLYSCSLVGDSGAESPFQTVIAAGGTGNVTLRDCTVVYNTAKTGDGLVEDSGAVAAIVNLEGGSFKLQDLGVGIDYTTTGMPVMDIGNRSGAAVSLNNNLSRRPTYEAGRSMSIYSPACSARFGHAEVVEFFVDSHPGQEPAFGVMPANGNSNELFIPDGEIWRITVTRISVGATVYSDKRHFIVRNVGGAVTVVASTTPDPRTVGTVSSTSLIVVQAGVAPGTIQVGSVDNVGTWTTQLTLHIEGAYNKAAM